MTQTYANDFDSGKALGGGRGEIYSTRSFNKTTRVLLDELHSHEVCLSWGGWEGGCETAEGEGCGVEQATRVMSLFIFQSKHLFPISKALSSML